MRRNTAKMFSGQVVRIAVQGGYFVLLARALGAAEFGAVAAVLALVALLSPFANLGAALLLVKNVSRNPATAPVQWANTVALSVLAGGTLSLLLVAASPAVAPSHLPIWVIAAVCVSDLVCARLVESSTGVYAAMDRMGRAGSLPAVMHAARLLTLGALALSPWDVTVQAWAITYLAGSVPTVLAVGAVTTRYAGWAWPKLSEYRAEWRAGALFSLGMSSQTVYNDMDKALLAKLSTLQATGIYSAAYRIIDMSYVPMRSLISVTYPDMLRAGEGGIRPVLNVVRRRLAVPAAAYCLAGTIAMVAGAGLIPLVLGTSFESSIPALRALSVLLIFKGLHFVAADTLTSANQQGARTVVQIGIAALNVILCLTMIPSHGWHGAVAASLICDGLLALALWGVIGWRVHTPTGQDATPTKDIVDSLPQGDGASVK